MKNFFFSILSLQLIFNTLQANNVNENNQFIDDINNLKYNISINYAPFEWKKNYLNWDIDKEFNHAKDLILSGRVNSAGDYHKVVQRIFKSLHDYHVNAEFYSRSLSFFPLLINEAENKYFISNFDHNLLYVNLDWMDLHWLTSNENYIHWHNEVFNHDDRQLLQPGNELVAIDGTPIDIYIENILNEELGKNRTPTAYSLARKMLFKRLGKRGQYTPNGFFTLTIKDQFNKTHIVRFPWLHFSEEILTRSIPIEEEDTSNFTIKNLKRKLEKNFSVSLAKDYIDHHYVEVKSSPRKIKGFLPDLGEKLWTYQGESTLYAYLYKNELNQNVGYIYLPTFHYDEIEEWLIIKDLEEILLKFKKSAHALVFDITNNSGGYLSFMYKILSMITNRPLKTLTEKEIINPNDIHDALILLELLSIQHAKEKNIEEKKELEELMYYFSHLIENYKDGKNISEETFYLGKEYILPDRKIFFNKPLIVLINELDFSCADFFPALLQDNKAALLFGNKTAGAGGAVYNYFPFSKFGVKRFSLTGTFSYRHNGIPLEDLGVTPDIPYEITIKDLNEQYSEYIKHLNKVIIKIIN